VHSCYVAVKSATNSSKPNSENEQNSDENSDPVTVNDATPQRKHISMRVCVSQSDKSDLQVRCFYCKRLGFLTARAVY